MRSQRVLQERVGELAEGMKRVEINDRVQDRRLTVLETREGL